MLTNILYIELQINHRIIAIRRSKVQHLFNDADLSIFLQCQSGWRSKVSQMVARKTNVHLILEIYPENYFHVNEYFIH